MSNTTLRLLSAEEIENFAVWAGSTKTYNIEGLLQAQQSLSYADHQAKMERVLKVIDSLKVTSSESLDTIRKINDSEIIQEIRISQVK